MTLHAEVTINGFLREQQSAEEDRLWHVFRIRIIKTTPVPKDKPASETVLFFMEGKKNINFLISAEAREAVVL
jgi:hypothetical protein